MTHRPPFHLPSSSSSWCAAAAADDDDDGDAPATPTPPKSSSSAPPLALHRRLPPLSSCGPEDGEGDDIITSHRRRRRLRLRHCSEEGSGRCAYGDDAGGASLSSASSSSSSSSSRTRRTRPSFPGLRAAITVSVVTALSACAVMSVVESFVIRPPSMMPRLSSRQWRESSRLPSAAAGGLAAGRTSGVGCRGWSSRRTLSSRLYHYAALRDDDFDSDEDDEEEVDDDGITNTFDGDEDSDDDDSANGGLDALSWLPSVHSSTSSSSATTNTNTSPNTSPTFTSTSPDLFYTASLPKLRPGAQVLPFFPLGGGGNSASLDSLGGEPHYWPGTTGHVLSIFEPRYRRMYADLIARGGASLSKDGASKIIGRSSLGKSLGWSGLSSKEENEDEEDKMRFVVSMPYPTDEPSTTATLMLDEDDLDSLGALYGDGDDDGDEGYEYLLADDEDSIPNDSSLDDSSLNDDSLFGMGSAKEGVFARYGVLMEVTSVQDVSSETDNQIKYVATHDVIGRVKIQRVLNPDCWEDEETYLTVEATLIDDEDDNGGGNVDKSGAGRGDDNSSASSKGMDVLTAVKQLLDEGIIDAVSPTSRTPPEFTSDELKLHATFANLVQLQHSLNTDVKFTTSSVHTFGKGTGGGSKGLWKTIDAWFQYVHQSLIARQAVMQKDFQERLLQFLKDNNKLNDKKEDRSGAGSFGSGDVGNLFKDDDEDEESLDDDEDEDGDDLPTAIDYNDLPPDLQREVHDVQVRTSAELGPIELERTVDAQRFLEVPTHTDRVKLLCSLVDRERRRLEAVKMLRGMFDGGGGGDGDEGSATSDDASASSADVKSTLDPNSEAATMNRFRSSLERLVVDSSSSTPSSSPSKVESKRKKGDDSFTEGADDDDDATYHGGESSDVDDDEGGREDGLPPPPSSSSMSSSRRIDGISGYGSSSGSGNKTGGGLGSGGVASIFLDGNDLDAFQ